MSSPSLTKQKSPNKTTSPSKLMDKKNNNYPLSTKTTMSPLLSPKKSLIKDTNIEISSRNNDSLQLSTRLKQINNIKQKSDSITKNNTANIKKEFSLPIKQSNSICTSSSSSSSSSSLTPPLSPTQSTSTTSKITSPIISTLTKSSVNKKSIIVARTVRTKTKLNEITKNKSSTTFTNLNSKALLLNNKKVVSPSSSLPSSPSKIKNKTTIPSTSSTTKSNLKPVIKRHNCIKENSNITNISKNCNFKRDKNSSLPSSPVSSSSSSSSSSTSSASSLNQNDKNNNCDDVILIKSSNYTPDSLETSCTSSLSSDDNDNKKDDVSSNDEYKYEEFEQNYYNNNDNDNKDEDNLKRIINDNNESINQKEQEQFNDNNIGIINIVENVIYDELELLEQREFEEEERRILNEEEEKLKQDQNEIKIEINEPIIVLNKALNQQQSIIDDDYSSSLITSDNENSLPDDQIDTNSNTNTNTNSILDSDSDNTLSTDDDNDNENSIKNNDIKSNKGQRTIRYYINPNFCDDEEEDEDEDEENDNDNKMKSDHFENDQIINGRESRLDNTKRLKQNDFLFEFENNDNNGYLFDDDTNDDSFECDNENNNDFLFNQDNDNDYTYKQIQQTMTAHKRIASAGFLFNRFGASYLAPIEEKPEPPFSPSPSSSDDSSQSSNEICFINNNNNPNIIKIMIKNYNIKQIGILLYSIILHFDRFFNSNSIFFIF
jgi:hypothetical protein